MLLIRRFEERLFKLFESGELNGTIHTYIGQEAIAVGCLNHLIKSNEMMASMLISLHNINFYQQFMSEIRKNIKNGTFVTFYKKYINYFN